MKNQIFAAKILGWNRAEKLITKTIEARSIIEYRYLEYLSLSSPIRGSCTASIALRANKLNPK
jgi:hypothetical protein